MYHHLYGPQQQQQQQQQQGQEPSYSSLQHENHGQDGHQPNPGCYCQYQPGYLQQLSLSQSQGHVQLHQQTHQQHAHKHPSHHDQMQQPYHQQQQHQQHHHHQPHYHSAHQTLQSHHQVHPQYHHQYPSQQQYPQAHYSMARAPTAALSPAPPPWHTPATAHNSTQQSCQAHAQPLPTDAATAHAPTVQQHKAPPPDRSTMCPPAFPLPQPATTSTQLSGLAPPSRQAVQWRTVSSSSAQCQERQSPQQQPATPQVQGMHPPPAAQNTPSTSLKSTPLATGPPAPSLPPPPQPSAVIVWDLDETLICFNSLLTGHYARANPGTKQDEAQLLGELWQDCILNLLDNHLHYQQLEPLDICQVGDVVVKDSPPPASTGGTLGPGTQPPLKRSSSPPQTEQQLAKRSKLSLQLHAASSPAACAAQPHSTAPTGQPGSAGPEAENTNTAAAAPQALATAAHTAYTVGTPASTALSQEASSTGTAITSVTITSVAGTDSSSKLCKQADSVPPIMQPASPHSASAMAAGANNQGDTELPEQAPGCNHSPPNGFKLSADSVTKLMTCVSQTYTSAARWCAPLSDVPPGAATPTPQPATTATGTALTSDTASASQPSVASVNTAAVAPLSTHQLDVTAPNNMPSSRTSAAPSSVAASAAAHCDAADQAGAMPATASATACSTGWMEEANKLHDATDKLTGGWLSASAQLIECLSDASRSNLEVQHVLVTTGQLVATLGKLLLFRLAHYFPVEAVYSASKEPKAKCFERIRRKFGSSSRYCVVGDGLEEERAALALSWPFIRVILGAQPTSSRPGPAPDRGPDALGTTGQRLPLLKADSILQLLLPLSAALASAVQHTQ